MLTELAIEPDRPREAARQPELSAEDLRSQCAARAQMYRLLSAVFVEEPGREFLDALRLPESLEGLAEAGLEFDADFLETDPDVLVDRLACEYTMMFASTGGFPPVESVRLTGRYQQEPLFSVRQIYRQSGFAVKPARFRLFEDQLGVELVFVAELLERSACALDRGDGAQYRKIEREVKRFWTLHLGKWVRGYARLVQRAAEHSFYREMARALERFAEDEIAWLRLKMDDADQARAVVPKAEVKVEFNPDEPVCNACSLAELEIDTGRVAGRGEQ